MYQEKGKQIQVIQQGDVIKCPPNVVHWHGATLTDTLTHIAISPNTDKGAAVWLEKVSAPNRFSYFVLATNLCSDLIGAFTWTQAKNQVIPLKQGSRYIVFQLV